MYNRIDHSQSQKILACYQSNDIEKSKFKKVVQVHKDGKTFNRVQEVGSDKEPIKSKHHGMDKLFDGDEQKKYEEHLKSLVEHKGKYYKLEDKEHGSTGRTSFGKGKHKGATQYQLHPTEEAYKKHLHKQDNSDYKVKDDKDLKQRLTDDNYYGTDNIQSHKAHKLLSDRENSDENKLAKEANNPKGRQLKEEEKEGKLDENEDLRVKNKADWINRSQMIQDEFKKIDEGNMTIRDLARLVNLKVDRSNILKPDTQMSYIDDKGQTKTGTWGQFKTWLKTQDSNPKNQKNEIKFRNLQFDAERNPFLKLLQEQKQQEEK